MKYSVKYDCLVCGETIKRSFREDENIPDYIECYKCNSLAKLDSNLTGSKLKKLLQGGGKNEEGKSGIA